MVEPFSLEGRVESIFIESGNLVLAMERSVDYEIPLPLPSGLSEDDDLGLIPFQLAFLGQNISYAYSESERNTGFFEIVRFKHHSIDVKSGPLTGMRYDVKQKLE